MTRPGDRPTAVATPDAAPGDGRRPGRYDLTWARRRDIRRLRDDGQPPGAPLPPVHAERGDPRYPSPHDLRTVISFIIDFLVHAGIGAVTFAAVDAPPARAFLAAAGAFLAASIIDRIVVQWAMQATVGKALLGIATIRDDTGGRPPFWKLVKQWFGGVLRLILFGIAG